MWCARQRAAAIAVAVVQRVGGAVGVVRAVAALDDVGVGERLDAVAGGGDRGGQRIAVAIGRRGRRRHEREQERGQDCGDPSHLPRHTRSDRVLSRDPSSFAGVARRARTPAFIPGMELAGAFYHEAVAPLVGDVPHAAALIGTGSDVLGFDTARSTDHGWGPRVQVFVDAADVEAVAGAVDAGLPDTFRDWPVRYGWGPVPVQHHVTVTTLPKWLVALLGVDATRPLAAADWLVTPQQLLLGVSGGAVFGDDTGELARARGARLVPGPGLAFRR